jgi:hypothetical protein
LGNQFLNVGQLEAAQAEFTQASSAEPYNAEAQLGSLKASVFDTIQGKEYDPELAVGRRCPRRLIGAPW